MEGRRGLHEAGLQLPSPPARAARCRLHAHVAAGGGSQPTLELLARVLQATLKLAACCQRMLVVPLCARTHAHVFLT